MGERCDKSVADRIYDQKISQTAMMERFPVLGPTRSNDDNLMRRSNLVGLSIDDLHLKRQLKPQEYRYFRWEPCFTTQSSTPDKTSALNGLRVDILRHGRCDGAPQATRIFSKTQLENGIGEYDSDTSENLRQTKNVKESGKTANYSCRNSVKTKLNDKLYVNNSFVVAADNISLLLQSTPPFAIRSVHEATSGRGGDHIRHLSHKDRGSNPARGSSPWSCSPLGTRLYLPRRFLPTNAKLTGLYRANTFTAQSCSDRLKNTRVAPSDGTAGRIVLRGIHIEQSHEHPAKDGKSSTQNNWYASLLPSSQWSADDTLNMATQMPTTKLSDMTSIKSMGDKHAMKTLTPSKHGYHPRSTSPTFKILVCASERLRESELNQVPRKSKPSDKFYYTDSPEPGRGVLQRCTQSFNSTDDSESTGSVSSRSGNNFQRFKRKSGHKKPALEVLSLNKIQDDRTHAKVTHQNQILPQGNSRPVVAFANDMEETSNDKGTIIQEDENLHEQIEQDDQLDNIGVVTTLPAVEVEKEDGQRTHMHFFLPQIVTSMSELSFTNHGEPDNSADRTDLTRGLLLNNAGETISQPDTDGGKTYGATNNEIQALSSKLTTKMFLPKQISRSDCDRNKPQPVKRVYVKPEPRKMMQIKNVTSSTKRSSVAQKGRSLPKQEQPNGRRKTGLPKQEQPTGRKETISSAHSDQRLPSEKLKEEMEDFPTLVSMDFS
ncbi:unnamed protein product [Lymnaea stagnalis]|uniref:Uncharacterized protein n=1 Tax=Lymnaea stagnalis TaxID=6523 RepID=A0AAV2H714_LYMST